MEVWWEKGGSVWGKYAQDILTKPDDETPRPTPREATIGTNPNWDLAPVDASRTKVADNNRDGYYLLSITSTTTPKTRHLNQGEPNAVTTTTPYPS